MEAPDLYGVLPPENAVVMGRGAPLYTPDHAHGGPMPSEIDARTQARKRPAGCCHSRRAREDSRERRLLSIPAAAALPLVHRRTTAGRAGPRAQRIGPGPRVVREGNGLRRRCRPRRSGGRQTPSRQVARVLRGPIRTRPDLAAEGQLRHRCSKRIRSSPLHPLTRLIPLSRPGCSRCRRQLVRRWFHTSGAQQLPSAHWRSSQ